MYAKHVEKVIVGTIVTIGEILVFRLFLTITKEAVAAVSSFG